MTIAGILTHRTIEGFAIGGHGFCAITLSGGVSLTLGQSGVFISAEDHGEQFGRPGPYDAEEEIRSRIVGEVIRSVDISRDTGDLTLNLDDGRIEIICASAGYEAYQVCGPDHLMMVGRGGCGEDSEPDGAANRSQPAGSGANRASPAAGSGG